MIRINICFYLLIILPIFLIGQNYAAIVVLNNNKTVYIDKQGNTTYTENIDPLINEHICPFKDGFARVRRSKSFEFITPFGQPIFNIKFDKAEDFFEGYAEVKVEGKWGFINQKGDIVIKPEFYETYRFSCGLAAITKSPTGKLGYIDTTGKIVIPLKYDFGHRFINNKAWVSENGKWGLIDRFGKYIISPTFSEAKDMKEGFSWVKQDGLWGMIDTTGQYYIKPNERNPLTFAQNANNNIFFGFNNGLVKYQANNKYGFLDKFLKAKIPAIYDEVTNFENNRSCIKLDGYWGVIDVTGRFIIQPNYEGLKQGIDGLYAVKDKDNNWGYLNEKNEWVIKPQFKKATPFQIIK